MSAVKEWATILCLSALASSMLEILSPSDKMEKIVRFVLGAFMICAILIPITKTFGNMSLDFKFNSNNSTDATSSFNQTVDDQINNLASDKIKALALDILNGLSVKSEKIDVIMDTGEDSSISIIKLTVWIKKEDMNKSGEIKNALEQKLGFKVEVKCK